MITCEEKARVDSFCPKHGVCHPRWELMMIIRVILVTIISNDNDVSAAARLGRSLGKEIAASCKVPSMQSQEQNQILER